MDGLSQLSWVLYLLKECVPMLKRRLALRESAVRERERAAVEKARSEEQLKCLVSVIAFGLVVVLFIASKPRFVLT